MHIWPVLNVSELRAQPKRLSLGVIVQIFTLVGSLLLNLSFIDNMASLLTPVCISFYSVLTYIFMIDVSLPNTAPTASPRVPEFTARILERLKPLMEVDEEIQNHVMEENGIGEEDERTQGIKLLKTSEWLKLIEACLKTDFYYQGKTKKIDIYLDYPLVCFVPVFLLW